jgi:hypothetical protein
VANRTQNHLVCLNTNVLILVSYVPTLGTFCSTNVPNLLPHSAHLSASLATNRIYANPISKFTLQPTSKYQTDLSFAQKELASNVS